MRQMTFAVGRASLGLIMITLLLTVPARAGAIRYDVIDLGTMVGTKGSYAYGINNANQVVFVTTDGHNGIGSWLYGDGKLTDLTTNFGSGVRQINDSGQIAGSAINNAGDVAGMGGYPWYPNSGFLRVGDQTTALPSLGGQTTWPNDINDLDQVVGTSQTAKGDMHPFLYDHGQMIDLLPGPEGAGWSEARAINNLGQIVGFTGPGRGGAFLYSDGHIQYLQAPGAQGLAAYGINDLGWIVGLGRFGDPLARSNHAFLYLDGTMLDLRACYELQANSGAALWSIPILKAM